MLDYPAHIKIKHYRSSSGLNIYAGQDDESNEYLTFKLAGPNDLWFHVADTAGSHVVLESNAREADKTSIREAAQTAAWFSKMRSGGKVTVHYLPLKNVSKPRRARPGQVHIRRAQKIKVQPDLLPSQPEES